MQHNVLGSAEIPNIHLLSIKVQPFLTVRTMQIPSTILNISPHGQRSRGESWIQKINSKVATPYLVPLGSILITFDG
jgi:hypothetical protein